MAAQTARAPVAYDSEKNMTKAEIKRLIAAVLAAIACSLGGIKLLDHTASYTCPACGATCVATADDE